MPVWSEHHQEDASESTFNPNEITYIVTMRSNNKSKDQIKDYKSNRHDQSILSIVSKIYGCEEKENEVWFKQRERMQFEFPFLAVQQGTYTNWQKVKFYSLYPKHIKSTIYFGDKKYIYQKASLLDKFIYRFIKKSK